MLTSKSFTVLRALVLVLIRFQHRKNKAFSISTTVFKIASYALPGLSLMDVCLSSTSYTVSLLFYFSLISPGPCT